MLKNISFARSRIHPRDRAQDPGTTLEQLMIMRPAMAIQRELRDRRRPPALPILARPEIYPPARLHRTVPLVASIAPATLETYAEAVRTLSGFLAERGMSTDVAVIIREHVEAFITDQLPRWRPCITAATNPCG